MGVTGNIADYMAYIYTKNKKTKTKKTKKTKTKKPNQNKTKALSRAWWCTPLIPALGRQRQADF